METITCATLSDASIRKRLNDLVGHIGANGEVRQNPYFDAGNVTAIALAQKLAKSRSFVERIARPVKIGVVFAMWGECQRLRAPSIDNPTGEDSLNVKVDALEWLFKDTFVEWHLYAVDDGCPDGSGDIAKTIQQASIKSKNITILKLGDAIPGDTIPLSLIRTVDDSVKGGAITYGCIKAIEDGCDYIAYTDSDNSVHLGQLGLLLESVIPSGKQAALGSRHLPSSLVMRHPGRNAGSVKILRHIVKLLGARVIPVTDVTSPFKIFTAPYLSSLIKKQTIFDLSFDYELVLSVYEDNIDPDIVGYVFIDSFEHSAWHSFGNSAIWYSYFKGYLRALETHKAPYNETVARIIRDLIRAPDDVSKIQGATFPDSFYSAPDSSIGEDEMLSADRLHEILRDTFEV